MKKVLLLAAAAAIGSMFLGATQAYAACNNNGVCETSLDEDCSVTDCPDCFCGAGEACIDKACVFVACDDKACGPDGLGGSCGECGAGKFCDIDACVDAAPAGCTATTVAGCSQTAPQCVSVTTDCDPVCTGAANFCLNGTCVEPKIGCDPACGADKVCQDVETVACGCETCVGDAIPACTAVIWGQDCVEACMTCGTTCEGCVANCTDKACGSDGCNGSCGTCDDGEECTDGACVEINNCGDITFDGCCAGEVVKWCLDGEVSTKDCNADVKCGWQDGLGYWCGTEGFGEDGGAPLACPACEKDCTGMNCGLDPVCGESCGTCDAGSLCSEAGVCEICEPACDGLECGDDGCGGSCGDCPIDMYCGFDGTCIDDPCEGVSETGCCNGEVLQFCSFGELVVESCEGDLHCGWLPGPMFYGCGSDGEADPDGVYPMVCEGGAVPNCDGKECGPDGAGGTCGTCDDGKVCDDTTGICGDGPCVPVCDGKDCGPDGCEGSCGTCEDGETCDDTTGICGIGCIPACGSNECGSDGCDGDCGTCDAGETCTDGMCVCVPDCTGKDCGDDGCGGSCGTCDAGTTCTAAGACDQDVQPDAEPDVVDPDVQADTSDDTTTTPDEDDDSGGGGGGGCSTQGGAHPGALLLLLGLVAVIPALRRRTIA